MSEGDQIAARRPKVYVMRPRILEAARPRGLLCLDEITSKFGVPRRTIYNWIRKYPDIETVKAGGVRLISLVDLVRALGPTAEFLGLEGYTREPHPEELAPIGRKLRSLRQRYSISLKTLAPCLGLEFTQLSTLERGKVKRPRAAWFQALDGRVRAVERAIAAAVRSGSDVTAALVALAATARNETDEVDEPAPIFAAE